MEMEKKKDAEDGKRKMENTMMISIEKMETRRIKLSRKMISLMSTRAAVKNKMQPTPSKHSNSEYKSQSKSELRPTRRRKQSTCKSGDIRQYGVVQLRESGQIQQLQGLNCKIIGSNPGPGETR